MSLLTDSTPRLRVLVVEDESLLAEELRTRLCRMGHEVVGTADRGSTAVQLAIELNPDIVLMDVALKGDMDGIEAGLEIHSSLGIPIVYLTALADDSTRLRSRNAARFGYLLKPVQATELRLAIDTAMERHGVERQRAAVGGMLTQSECEETLGRMAGGIAHEFNNMLAVIMGGIDLIERDLEPDDYLRQRLGTMRVAGLRARDLVERIVETTNPPRRNRERGGTYDGSPAAVPPLQRLNGSHAVDRRQADAPLPGTPGGAPTIVRR